MGTVGTSPVCGTAGIPGMDVIVPSDITAVAGATVPPSAMAPGAGGAGTTTGTGGAGGVGAGTGVAATGAGGTGTGATGAAAASAEGVTAAGTGALASSGAGVCETMGAFFVGSGASSPRFFIHTKAPTRSTAAPAAARVRMGRLDGLSTGWSVYTVISSLQRHRRCDGYSRALLSIQIVTGPSFTSATCMSAPKIPRSTP